MANATATRWPVSTVSTPVVLSLSPVGAPGAPESLSGCPQGSLFSTMYLHEAKFSSFPSRRDTAMYVDCRSRNENPAIFF